MKLTILDSNLIKTYVVDVFDSLIWTDRYFGLGDFEIFTRATEETISALKEDYYLSLIGSEHVMIIESLNLKTDLEDGNKFILRGRSLESILDRRIIWNQTVLSGSLQAGIKRLLDENAIAPEDPDRRMASLVFEESADPNITSLFVDAQFTGDNLYTVIQQLCESNEIGFKITLSPSGTFVFKLYSGADRSFGQLTNPFVAFSPKLDNLSDSNYYHSKVPYKTVTLVAGEGEGSERLTTMVMIPSGAGTDLNRREKFTDARDISTWVNGEVISPEEYYSQLYGRGLFSLLNSTQISTFDGKVDATVQYVYGIDFLLGDIVQVINEYGLQGRTRVTELIFSEDISGENIYPTFEKIE